MQRGSLGQGGGLFGQFAYRKRKTDAAFRNGWFEAVREGYAKLELVLLERAFKGTPKLVRTARGTDRVMREYSTTLGIALLRRHAEIAGVGNADPAPEEVEEIRARIVERLERMRMRSLPAPEPERDEGTEYKSVDEGCAGRLAGCEATLDVVLDALRESGSRTGSGLAGGGI